MDEVIMWMIVFGSLAMANVLNYGEAQPVHVVGDTIGWTVPPDGAAAYSNWASCNTFNLGDMLEFNFETCKHDVLQVPKESFDACTTANPIGTSFTTGPAHITLNSSGVHYFICTFPNHCKRGQKLAVTVQDCKAASPPPAANSPPPAVPLPPTPAPAPSAGSIIPPATPPPATGPSGYASPPAPPATGPSGADSPSPPPAGGATDSPKSGSSSTGLTLALASTAMAVCISLIFN